MNSEVLLRHPLTAFVSLLLVATLVVGSSQHAETMRRRALWLSFATALLSFVGSVAWFADHGVSLREIWSFGDRPLLVLEPLGATLLPTASFATFGALLGISSQSAIKKKIRIILWALIGHAILFLGAHVALLLIGYLLGLLPAFAENAAAKERPPLSARLIQGVGLGGLIVTVILMSHLGLLPGGFVDVSIQGSPSFEPHGSEARLSFALLILSVLVRNAVFPFHTWAPLLAQDSGLVRLSLLIAPQAGAVVLLRVAAQTFPDGLSAFASWLTPLALLGALYSALMASVASTTRRAFAWLFISQSAIVLSGIETKSSEGLAGALLLWMSGSLSITGAALALHMVEARIGNTHLDDHYGLGSRTPRLAGAFLLLGLSVVGIPGTIGFVAEDLLVHGVLDLYPWLGASIVLATAANGYVVLKAYFRLFGGQPAERCQVPDLLPREAMGLTALGIVLLALGIFPFLVTDHSSSLSRATELSHR